MLVTGSPAPGPFDNAYLALSGPVSVRVMPSYLPAESDPSGGRWVFAYTVEICNSGPETVQLLSRRWEITDGLGRTSIVEGDGVVGEQPVLEAGACFVYRSGCPLPTPSGFMGGLYRMRTADGIEFTARIPDFSLDSPDSRIGAPN